MCLFQIGKKNGTIQRYFLAPSDEYKDVLLITLSSIEYTQFEDMQEWY